MTLQVPQPVLSGSKALVVGIANENSIAWGCAKAFRELGADVAVTYLNEKSLPYVQPPCGRNGVAAFPALDVSAPEQWKQYSRRSSAQWGRLDILVHSIAWAPRMICRADC